MCCLLRTIAHLRAVTDEYGEMVQQWWNERVKSRPRERDRQILLSLKVEKNNQGKILVMIFMPQLLLNVPEMR
jgi:hypothetical protein